MCATELRQGCPRLGKRGTNRLQSWGAWFLMALAASPPWCIRAHAQVACDQPGPDLIVGDITAVHRFGALGGMMSYSVDTVLCNVGTVNASWVNNSPAHPIVGQNAFRLKDGRFEHIGQAWARHPLQTTLQAFCGCNCNGAGVNVLGAGCSRAFCCGYNGDQFYMGPKSEINAHTGGFAFPYTGFGETGDSIFRRLQVAGSDVDPAQNSGGLYFVEAQYLAADDAAAGRGDNNCSFRAVVPTPDAGQWDLVPNGPTQIGLPAIRAWKATDPGVLETDLRVPDEGLLILAARAMPRDGGFWRYEYAIQNVNSDRGVRLFSVPLSALTTVVNVGFHDVNYHSGEPFAGDDWNLELAPTAITWSTAAHDADPNANALRWGTLYNFRFDADVPPQAQPASATVQFFKPGTPAGMIAATVIPAPKPLAIFFPNGAPTLVAPQAPANFDVRIVNGSQTVVPGTPMLHHRPGGGGTFQATPLTPLGGELYRATLPAAACGATLEYYVSAQGSGGAVAFAPIGAPAVTVIAEVGTLSVVHSDDFSTNQGWTTSAVSTTGGWWERGVPLAVGTVGAPIADFNGAGACWLTENAAGDSDVDGGPVRLVSPDFDLTGLLHPRIRYARWFHNGNLDVDRLVVEITSDSGLNWTAVESVPHQGGWQVHEFRVDDFVAPSAQVQVRFVVADSPNNSITEAAVDAFAILELSCEAAGCVRGDVNGDGGVDGRDVSRFAQIAVGGGGSANEICAGDLQATPNGAIDPGDIPGFVVCLLAGGC